MGRVIGGTEDGIYIRDEAGDLHKFGDAQLYGAIAMINNYLRPKLASSGTSEAGDVLTGKRHDVLDLRRLPQPRYG